MGDTLNTIRTFFQFPRSGGSGSSGRRFKNDDIIEEEELVSLVGGRRDVEKGPIVQGDGVKGDVAVGANSSRVVLSISGMHCSSCSSAVESALEQLPGVFKANVALMSESAEVLYNPFDVDPTMLVRAVEEAGFEASVKSGGGQSLDHDQDKVLIRIGGMHCSSCTMAVEKALMGVPGVQQASVSLPTNMAEVKYTHGKITIMDLVKTVEDCGFSAEALDSDSTSRLLLAIEGMTCSSCSTAVENALMSGEGVMSAHVNLMSNSAEIVYNSSMIGARDIIQLVQDAGFEGSLKEENTDYYDHNAKETARYRRLATVAAVFTVPVFLIAMVLPGIRAFQGLYSAHLFGFPLDQILKFLLVTPVQFIIGWPFHSGAYRAIKAGRANMDVLVSFGTNASYMYSMISVLHHHVMLHHESGNYTPTDFFETAAMLITFVFLGKYLESSAKGKTSEAIVKLCEMAPTSAILVDSLPNGDVMEKEIPSNLIQKGDVLKILPGSRVPADGVVVKGSSFVDESLLTGESVPVSKNVDDNVFGGTVNAGGMMHMKAERVGSDTTISQIVRLVEGAQLSKAPVQAVADKISAVFVPIVVALSLLTTLIWYIAGISGIVPDSWIPPGHSLFLFCLMFGIAVMVIACPCALGLATPTAVMVGTGVAATNGVLIKGGDVLEMASNVKTVIFDKTGTLTTGKPSVVDFQLLDNIVPGYIAVQMAASLEKSSEHPLALAILQFEDHYLDGNWLPQTRPSMFQNDGDMMQPSRRSQKNLERVLSAAENVNILVGEGLEATIPMPESLQSALQCGAFASVLLGNAKLMKKNNVTGMSPGELASRYAVEMESRGCTCVYLSMNGRLVAIFSIMDPIKPESRGVVAALHQMKVKCVLLTGDNWRTARAVASQLGISNIHAEVLPGGKSAVVEEFQKQRSIVAMVGDGINDSPALALSDVGIAIGSGADVAVEAADIVLVKSDLEDVLMALDLCRKTFQRIKWNYIWALGYNVVMIPIAAGCLYPFFEFQLPPWIAGACMALSSVSVVGSSLLLRRYTRPKRVRRDC